MWETIRGYLTFTRKERFGVLFLLFIISILFVLPYFFQRRPGDPVSTVDEKMQREIQKFETTHPDSARYTEMHNRDVSPMRVLADPGQPGATVKRQLFYFDPNDLSREGWIKLGLPEHLTQTILHFIERGGRFHKPEDLKKIYGLHAEDYERLFPYVHIINKPEPAPKLSGFYSKEINIGNRVKKTDSLFNTLPARIPGETASVYVSKHLEVTDINGADTSQWSRLPGIGTKLALRIVHFREKLGGFYQVEQVGETFGLPDSTFQKIKPVLQINPARIVLIHINTATKEALQLHPYIRWQIASAIVEYRNQHGKFRSVDELMQLVLMDSGRFIKLKPYLTTQP